MDFNYLTPFFSIYKSFSSEISLFNLSKFLK